MSQKINPADHNDPWIKGSPKHAAQEGPDTGRPENEMLDVPLGSENDRRGASRGRPKAS
jgi:hypothetical protein